MKGVLVVGAGPVGLTLAVELARRGVQCRVIDKSPRRSETSRALLLWTRTLELLQPMGCLREVWESGRALSGTSIYDEHLRPLLQDSWGHKAPRAMVLPQPELEGILEERLQSLGGKVERGVELVSFEEEPEQVTAHLRYPLGVVEPAPTGWMIGCDGVHSAARRGLGLEFEGPAQDTVWCLADVLLTGAPDEAEVTAYLHPQGVVMLYPIRPPLFRLMMDLGERELKIPTLDQVQLAVQERCHPGIAISGAVWLSSYRIQEGKVKDYGQGRVFLAGDAAHVHSPIGGRGMNTGMQDAVNLAWKLALVVQGRAGARPLLSTYSAERQPIGVKVVRTTGVLTKIVGWRNPLVTRLRDRLIAVLTQLGGLQRHLRQDVCYPKSWLSDEPRDDTRVWRARAGVPPGHQAPDGDLEGTRLWQLGSPDGFTLLLFEDPEGQTELKPIADWMQLTYDGLVSCLRIPASTESLHRIYDVPRGGLYLIRPDGYVAFRCQPASLRHLQDYLHRIGLGVPDPS